LQADSLQQTQQLFGKVARVRVTLHKKASFETQNL